jgi:FlaA1/EpsC-like NDP-sugar epimerase
VIVKYLGDKDTKIEYVGARPGERYHEVLIAQDEVCRTLEFPGYFVVFPYQFLADEIPQLGAYKTVSRNGRQNGLYSSEIADKLTHRELAEKLRDLGLLPDKRLSRLTLSGHDHQ